MEHHGLSEYKTADDHKKDMGLGEKAPVTALRKASRKAQELLCQV